MREFLFTSQGLIIVGAALIGVAVLCLSGILIAMITAIGYMSAGLGALAAGYGLLKMWRGMR